MDPIILSASTWLLQQAGGVLFALAQQYLSEKMGLGSSQQTRSAMRSLLDEYLQRLTARLDEDRIARLYGAFTNLKVAPNTAAKDGLLVEALDRFHEIAHLPEQGTTGERSNAELRCLAFLGMASTHMVLNDRRELIAEKIVEAVYADPDTARQWLGEDIVRGVLLNTPKVTHQTTVQQPSQSAILAGDSRGASPPLIIKNPTSQQIAQALQSDVNPYGSWGKLKIDGSTKRTIARMARSSASYLGNSATIKKQGRGSILHFASDRPNWSSHSFTTDFAFQVEVTFFTTAPNSTNFCGGIFFRRSTIGFIDRYYCFSVSGCNNYSLDFVEMPIIGDKKITNLTSGTIGIHTNIPILMGVVVQGNLLDLYLNLRHLGRIEDTSASQGYLGVAVGNWKDDSLDTEARFRNLMAWAR